MLGDDAGRRLELGDGLEGGVGVAEVVVAQLLALDLARSGDAEALPGGVESRFLVRILTVTEALPALAREDKALGESLSRLLGEPGGDGRVVGGRPRERLGGELASERQRRAAVRLHLGDEPGILRRVGEDGDAGVVLGRRADHGGAADVHLLDAFVRPGA